MNGLNWDLLYSTQLWLVSNCDGCEIMVSVDDENEGRSTVAAIGRQAGR